PRPRRHRLLTFEPAISFFERFRLTMDRKRSKNDVGQWLRARDAAWTRAPIDAYLVRGRRSVGALTTSAATGRPVGSSTAAPIEVAAADTAPALSDQPRLRVRASSSTNASSSTGPP